MFRKSMIAAMVALSASSAFAGPGKARETERKDEKKDGVTAPRETGKTAGSVNDTAKILDIAADVAGKATSQRESAQLIQDIANNPARFGLEGVSEKGVQNFLLEVEKLMAGGKSADEALDMALARRGTNKEDLKEKCKPI